MTTLLFILFLALLAFYGYFQIRKSQNILDEKPNTSSLEFTSNSFSPKEYGLRFGNGASRIKKHNRLRYAK